MTDEEGCAWRAFPWDMEAEEGKPLSASFIPAAQGWGRFVRPGEPASVLYLAESPAHAVGEKIQDLRGQTLERGDLEEFGHPLALVSITPFAALRAEMVDLCDPETLSRYSIAPDELAARGRAVTQEISERLYGEGVPGFRWWSAFFGEWHTLVLFLDRVGERLEYGTPERLDPGSTAVQEAAQLLGVRVVEG